jgi:four helix bundle protein
MQDFRNLKVWQKAHALTIAVYQASAKLPGDERFGLTLQLRRSAASIPMHMADGCGRTTEAEFLKCLSFAMGGGNQLEYHLLLTHDLGYLADAEHSRLTADVIEVKRMIVGLIHTISGQG